MLWHQTQFALLRRFQSVHQDARGQDLELIESGTAIGEFRRHYFALLGDAHAPADRSRRLRRNRATGRRPASAHRAAAAMEEADLDARHAGNLNEATLRLIEFETGAEEAAILVGIRIAEHDFLAAAER